MPRAKYQVGFLMGYESDDPEYGDWDSALSYALHIGQIDETIGIWSSQDEGSDLLAIIYQGEVFKK